MSTTVAIVSGGSGGIGAAPCRALAAAGHHVLVGRGRVAAVADQDVMPGGSQGARGGGTDATAATADDGDGR
ncbi:MAG: hypothetical protein R6U94_08980, partial [Nitriliruptoraceae bacterium]